MVGISEMVFSDHSWRQSSRRQKLTRVTNVKPSCSNIPGFCSSYGFDLSDSIERWAFSIGVPGQARLSLEWHLPGILFAFHTGTRHTRTYQVQTQVCWRKIGRRRGRGERTRPSEHRTSWTFESGTGESSRKAKPNKTWRNLKSLCGQSGQGKSAGPGTMWWSEECFTWQRARSRRETEDTAELEHEKRFQHRKLPENHQGGRIEFVTAQNNHEMEKITTSSAGETCSPFAGYSPIAHRCVVIRTCSEQISSLLRTSVNNNDICEAMTVNSLVGVCVILSKQHSWLRRG